MKLLIDVEKDYYEMIKYNVEHGQEYKPFEIIANGIPYEERPQGEWLVDDWSKIIECNKCRGQAPIDITSGEQYRSNFCPICGADMKGGAV